MLRDGGTAHIRPIGPDDAGRLVDFYEQVSDESKYYRFFAPYPRLSDRDVHRFTHHDYDDRVGLAAVVGGEFIATVRYDRTDEQGRAVAGRSGTRAEVAFLVQDAHQGRGVASALLEHIARRGPRARHPALHRRGAARQPQDGQGLHRRRLHPAAQLRRRRGPPRPRPRTHRRVRAGDAGPRAPRRGPLGAAAAAPRLGRRGRHRPPARRRRPHAAAQPGRGRVHRAAVRGQPRLPRVGRGRRRRGRRTARCASIGAPVDLAVVAVPADRVPEAVADCGAAGVRGLVVVAAGYSETGPEGRSGSATWSARPAATACA